MKYNYEIVHRYYEIVSLCFKDLYLVLNPETNKYKPFLWIQLLGKQENTLKMIEDILIL